MTIADHLTELMGQPVKNYNPDEGLVNPADTAYRLTVADLDYDSEIKIFDRMAAFFEEPHVSEVTNLVIGLWDWEGFEVDSRPIVEALVAAQDQLPHLQALFLGDIVGEECEISWIQQTDISPLFLAYPQLRYLGVRGGEGLRLGIPTHEHLQTLVIESGGLSAAVVRDISAAQLPNLEHLELWLGEDNYGGDTTVEDLSILLAGERFPQLRYLGLRDSQIADEIAIALATAPVLNQLSTLDLSLGTLTDRGAEALLASPDLPTLDRLDLHHHYLSEAMMARLQALPLTVNVADRQEADEYDGETWRYIAVSE
ncbi:STM4015 family protein [Acaryochloris sp. IP29b_bin.148]|uniref:STM4015 family protein n=1 Tax=Acaryochloris sp. IP29b_bin.148 TaxID=2969218 RepID=UPI002622E4F8|nr:STM4015 family protein [Acaryochloris sp. IP29b_bin.148]